MVTELELVVRAADVAPAGQCTLAGGPTDITVTGIGFLRADGERVSLDAYVVWRVADRDAVDHSETRRQGIRRGVRGSRSSQSASFAQQPSTGACTQPLAESQPSVVQASSSSQGAVLFVCWQPSDGSHQSSVHSFPSSQLSSCSHE